MQNLNIWQFFFFTNEIKPFQFLIDQHPFYIFLERLFRKTFFCFLPAVQLYDLINHLDNYNNILTFQIIYSIILKGVFIFQFLTTIRAFMLTIYYFINAGL